MFLFMNPHGCEWKIRGWKFQLSLSQRFLCPLTSCLFPGILFPKFSPDFTMLRSMDFISVICSLSKGMGVPLVSPANPLPIWCEVKTSHWWGFKGNVKVLQGLPIWGGHSPGCKRLLTTFHSLQGWRTTWYSLQHIMRLYTANPESITLPWVLSGDMNASLNKHPIQMGYSCSGVT